MYFEVSKFYILFLFIRKCSTRPCFFNRIIVSLNNQMLSTRLIVESIFLLRTKLVENGAYLCVYISCINIQCVFYGYSHQL